MPPRRGCTILPAQSSAAILSQPARRPRFTLRRRPQSFHDAFEDRALFYDCFWHADGRRVLLVGPPPMNLDYSSIRFTASGNPLAARFHTSLSVSICELDGVPSDAHSVVAKLGDEVHTLAIQPNRCAELSGRRLIFAMSRDNELSWIREWALWHVRHHGADAAVLIDNGSVRYAPEQVSETLAGVEGLATVAVHSWPQRFGAVDRAVFNNPYWAHFLQICAMSMVLRRYGMAAHGLVNCDIDELAATRSGRSVFDLARESRGGLVVFRGRWVEALPAAGSGDRPPHSAYRHVAEDARAAQSRQRKWALDPSRPFVERLAVHPYWHWIEGRARGSKTMSDDAFYWHFRGINTHWKRRPPDTSRQATRIEPALERAFAALDP